MRSLFLSLLIILSLNTAQALSPSYQSFKEVGDDLRSITAISNQIGSFQKKSTELFMLFKSFNSEELKILIGPSYLDMKKYLNQKQIFMQTLELNHSHLRLDLTPKKIKYYVQSVQTFRMDLTSNLRSDIKKELVKSSGQFQQADIIIDYLSGLVAIQFCSKELSQGQCGSYDLTSGKLVVSSLSASL